MASRFLVNELLQDELNSLRVKLGNSQSCETFTMKSSTFIVADVSSGS